MTALSQMNIAGRRWGGSGIWCEKQESWRKGGGRFGSSVVLYGGPDGSIDCD